jgi:hypothetical protein
MIEHVDRAIERFFRANTPLPENAAAISFETPDRTWGAARTRPTVNMFLSQVSRSARTRTGMQQRVDDSGARQRRPITPIVDLRYVITAWATEPRDEHQLLGALLSCVLANPFLPDDALPEALSGTRLGLSLAPAEARSAGEFWNSLGGAPRAALQIDVTLPLEVFAWRDVAAPAEAIELSTVHQARPVARVMSVEEEHRFTRRRVNGGAMLLEGHVVDESNDSDDSAAQDSSEDDRDPQG